LATSGFGWVAFLSRPLASYLIRVILAASALGEIPLHLWLIVVGGTDQGWKGQAGAAKPFVQADRGPETALWEVIFNFGLPEIELRRLETMSF
jgi:hypothetical protein